jgi:hypothetical protein
MAYTLLPSCCTRRPGHLGCATGDLRLCQAVDDVRLSASRDEDDNGQQADVWQITLFRIANFQRPNLRRPSLTPSTPNVVSSWGVRRSPRFPWCWPPFAVEASMRRERPAARRRQTCPLARRSKRSLVGHSGSRLDPIRRLRRLGRIQSALRRHPSAQRVCIRAVATHDVFSSTILA